MHWHKFILITCVGGLAIALSTLVTSVGLSSPCNGLGCKSQQEQNHKQLSLENLRQQAKSITVKVMSQDDLGSGFLLKKQGNLYTVLTNAHVLQAGNAPYRVQTWDGRIWEAQTPKNVKSLNIKSLQGNDLALLQFRSTGTIYTVASVSSSLGVGDEVFAAGFTFTESETQAKNFTFATGKVSLILKKALEGGYQVGYTNDIQKGMSGGPLLNCQGEVVGVNGMHAYPLWDIPSVFADGKQVDPALHQKIIRLSWAVPIKTAVEFP